MTIRCQSEVGNCDSMRFTVQRKSTTRVANKMSLSCFFSLLLPSPHYLLLWAFIITDVVIVVVFFVIIIAVVVQVDFCFTYRLK